MNDPARILFLYTGGTIGMRKGPRGLEPAPGYLRAQMERLPQFCDLAEPRFTTPPSRFGRRVRYDIQEYDPLLDSANMGMDDWVRIAREVEARYREYDAFVVLHGTDTMAYTASALSFLLENLDKTVIVTGSQVPLDHAHNDALGNLLGSLTIAGHFEIPEVCLYFGDKLFRGNRAQKVDAEGFDAFASANFPPLAEVGAEFSVRWELVRRPPPQPLRVHARMNPNVAALRLFPGITAEILSNFLRPPVEGLVLETYGTGNAPDRRKDIMDALREATGRGVVVVNCTQCTRGMVSAAYAAGSALAEAGVVGGADMTAEAALAKLGWLLGQGLPRDEVKRRLQADLRGELTEAPATMRFSYRERS